jgi:hypothetical protein
MSKYPSTGANPAPLSEQPVFRRETPRIPSFVTTVEPTSMAKHASPVYTGTKMIGIGTLHKSNSVPVFSEEQAIEISTMRRG